MRYCLFLFAFLLSCQDTKSEKKITLSISETKSVSRKTVESNEKTEPLFLLTDKNAKMGWRRRLCTLWRNRLPGRGENPQRQVLAQALLQLQFVQETT